MSKNESANHDFFCFPPHLFPRLSVALTVLLGSLQAHDGHEGQKSRAQVCLGRGGEATGGRRVWRGFRQELAPVGGIGVDVVEIVHFFVSSPKHTRYPGR